MLEPPIDLRRPACLLISLPGTRALQWENFLPADRYSQHQQHLNPPRGLTCQSTFSARTRTPTMPTSRRRLHLTRRRSQSLQLPLTFDLKPLPPSPLKRASGPSQAGFGYQINFDFCRHTVQNSASSPNCLKPGFQPTTRACAKLLVRSGLRCCWCFSLKSDCLCLETLS